LPKTQKYMKSLGTTTVIHNVRLEVLTRMLMKIQVFWDVMTQHLIRSYQHIGGAFCLAVQGEG